MSEAGVRVAAVGSARQPDPGSACGQLLVRFRETAADPPPERRVDAAWSRPSGAGPWVLEPSPRWKGYALRRIDAAPWTLWLVGDLAEGAGSADRLLADVAFGRRDGRDLNGSLLLLGWNAAENRWHVWTDRFATVHAYHSESSRGAALGTSFGLVSRAASARRLDGEALCGYLACGFFPADRTFYDDVRILRPASHYVFDATGRRVSEERYASWRHVPDSRRSRPDTAAELADLLRRVLAEQTAAGRVAIPISGGLDSRTTVALLTEPGRPAPPRFWSYTYGYGDDSVETDIGRRVAAARGLPVRSLTIGRYLFERLDDLLDSVEGFQDVTQTRQTAVSGLLASDADSVVAAHWGDVWLDDMGIGADAPDAEPLAARAFAKVRKRGREWLLREIAAPRVPGEDPETLVRAFVASELERVGELEDPDFRVKAFKTDQWSFRWTVASLRAYRLGATPKLPFYDTRIADFFATVPTAYVAGRALQIELLRRFAPDLARITWQAFGTDLFRLRHYDTWLVPWRAARKAARLLRREPAALERNWEVQYSGPGRARLDQWLVRPGLRIHELVAPDRIRELLAAFDAAPLENGRGYTVSMLLTLSAWLERNG
ncbi:MAG TPA: hypothetical protein VH854_08525 [Thermoanaerobaculia bacterium]|nr:hypothetical protein [Thermoanaerobaculia bacterium]